jgi:flagellar P-ring protein precursor FlgI
MLRHLILFVLLASFSHSAMAASRIKDIVSVEGIRDNMLVGYGLVVGLNGTGDNLRNSPFTEQGLTDFLSRLGIDAKGSNLQTRNIAAVSVTASLPAFSRSGNKIDIVVSTMGDSKSLAGGTLLATPLIGADGNVYAVAQGRVSLGELVTTKSNSNTRNGGVPTSGFILTGATVEREIAFELESLKTLNLSLHNPDISTARRITENINDVIGEDAAKALDPATVRITVPEIYDDNIIGLLADIEQIIVQPDRTARIVVDESSGTIVIGEDVRVGTVAIAQGNLLVTVREKTQVGGSAFFSDAEDDATTQQVSANTDPGNGLAILRQGTNLRDLVSGLNALGVGTRDLITILQTIKAAGALQAEIETR